MYNMKLKIRVCPEGEAGTAKCPVCLTGTCYNYGMLAFLFILWVGKCSFDGTEYYDQYNGIDDWFANTYCDGKDDDSLKVLQM